MRLGRALCGASSFGAGRRRACDAGQDGGWACVQGMAEEHLEEKSSMRASVSFVDLLNDHLCRACDEVVGRVRLVVVEIAQLGRF